MNSRRLRKRWQVAYGIAFAAIGVALVAGLLRVAAGPSSTRGPTAASHVEPDRNVEDHGGVEVRRGVDR